MLENRSKEIHNHPDPILELTEREIKEFFNDKTDVVYIPAGRSMITLLSNQMNYIYSSMDDIQTGKIALVLGSTGNKGESRRKDFGLLLDQHPEIQVFLTADDPNYEDPMDIADEISIYNQSG